MDQLSPHKVRQHSQLILARAPPQEDKISRENSHKLLEKFCHGGFLDDVSRKKSDGEHRCHCQSRSQGEPKQDFSPDQLDNAPERENDARSTVVVGPTRSSQVHTCHPPPVDPQLLLNCSTTGHTPSACGRRCTNAPHSLAFASHLLQRFTALGTHGHSPPRHNPSYPEHKYTTAATHWHSTLHTCVMNNDHIATWIAQSPQNTTVLK